MHPHFTLQFASTSGLAAAFDGLGLDNIHLRTAIDWCRYLHEDIYPFLENLSCAPRHACPSSCMHRCTCRFKREGADTVSDLDDADRNQLIADLKLVCRLAALSVQAYTFCCAATHQGAQSDGAVVSTCVNATADHAVCIYQD